MGYKSTGDRRRHQIAPHSMGIASDGAFFLCDSDHGQTRAGPTTLWCRRMWRKALESGVTGTPTFFSNRRRLVGAQPLESFVRVSEAELSRARGGRRALPVSRRPLGLAHDVLGIGADQATWCLAA